MQTFALSAMHGNAAWCPYVGNIVNRVSTTSKCEGNGRGRWWEGESRQRRGAQGWQDLRTLVEIWHVFGYFFNILILLLDTRSDVGLVG